MVQVYVIWVVVSERHKGSGGPMESAFIELGHCREKKRKEMWDASFGTVVPSDHLFLCLDGSGTWLFFPRFFTLHLVMGGIQFSGGLWEGFNVTMDTVQGLKPFVVGLELLCAFWMEDCDVTCDVWGGTSIISASFEYQWPKKIISMRCWDHGSCRRWPVGLTRCFVSGLLVLVYVVHRSM